MKVELSPCYVLHRREYRETSLLLEVFSREYGRLSLLAKGAKRKKDKGNDFNLYQKYNISWVAKSELGTLTDIESVSSNLILTSSHILAGFYVNELLMRLLHKHESHPELFDAYEKAIDNLLDNQPEQIVLRYFEKNLLQSLGYGIVLDVDVDTGEEICPDKDYYYQFDYGPSFHSQNTRPGIKISGKTLLEINSESLLDSEHINEAKFLFKSILNRYLGSKPLASRELYQSYIQNKKAV